MKRMLRLSLVIAALAVVPVSSAHAATTGNHGQPNQSCQTAFPTGPLTPRGFNTTGFAHAETMYAGAQMQNSNNPKSVSQYDVACFQAAQHP